jgi:hypothetical protein
MTLQLIPTKSCTKCGGSNWKQAGAIKVWIILVLFIHVATKCSNLFEEILRRIL